VDQRERSIEIPGAGTGMRWLEYGDADGLPVVLLHGIPTSPVLWRRVVPLLAASRVLAPEMVGYGDSAPRGQGRDLSLSAQADYLLDWLAALGISRAVLVGHDLGGGVAQIVATRRPELCAGLVLTNAVSYDSWPIPSVKMMQKAAPLVARFPDAAIYPSVASLIRRGHDSLERARDAIAVHWAPYVRHGAAQTLMRQVRALDVRDTLEISPRLVDLNVPARVVWGEADQFQRVAYGERLAEALRTRLHRIRGARHFTPEDHPGEIASAVHAIQTDIHGGS
jgi:pimeloyl-ACP methyl ester carboxylesterase